MKQMKQKGIALAIGLAMLCSGWLTACSGQSNGTDATAAAESPSAEYGAMDTVGGAMPQAANEESAVETDAGAGGLDTAARPTDGEKLIENLYYEIETLQFDDSVEQIQSLYSSGTYRLMSYSHALKSLRSYLHGVFLPRQSSLLPLL